MARRKHLLFLLERTYNHFRDAMHDGLASGCTELVYVCMLVLFRSVLNLSIVSFRKVDFSEQGITVYQSSLLLHQYICLVDEVYKGVRISGPEHCKSPQRYAISGPPMVTYRATYLQWIVYISVCFDICKILLNFTKIAVFSNRFFAKILRLERCKSMQIL